MQSFHFLNFLGYAETFFSATKLFALFNSLKSAKWLINGWLGYNITNSYILVSEATMEGCVSSEVTMVHFNHRFRLKHISSSKMSNWTWKLVIMWVKKELSQVKSSFELIISYCFLKQPFNFSCTDFHCGSKGIRLHCLQVHDFKKERNPRRLMHRRLNYIICHLF